MTAPPSAVAPITDERLRLTVRRVESRLDDARARLHADHSVVGVRAARRALEEAERVLGALDHDPWDPSVLPLRQARQALSSHLLAAAACDEAEVAPSVTARVLRRGSDAALRALARHAEGGAP